MSELRLTIRDRIAIAKISQNQKEVDVAESAVHLVAKFHEPPITADELLEWTLEELLEAFKTIQPRIVEASKAGEQAMAELRGKLH